MIGFGALAPVKSDAETLYLRPERAATRFAKRETLRLPIFLWTTPFETARIVSDSAFFKAFCAVLASPAAIASSVARHEERIRVRRALLTSVRRPMTRFAFFADFVFAMF